MKPFAKLTLIRTESHLHLSSGFQHLTVMQILREGRLCRPPSGGLCCLLSITCLSKSLPLLLRKSNLTHSRLTRLQCNPHPSAHRLQGRGPDSGLAYQSTRPGDFPGGPVVKTSPSSARGCSRSLVGELISHMPPGQKTKT